MSSISTGKTLQSIALVAVTLLLLSALTVVPAAALERGDAPQATTHGEPQAEPLLWSGDWLSTLWYQLVSWVGTSSTTSTATTTCDPNDPNDPNCSDGGETTMGDGGGMSGSGDGGEGGPGLDVGG